MPASVTHGYLVHALVEAWIAQHPAVDSALQVTVIILLVVVGLAGICGIIYLVLWLVRLLTPRNLTSLIRTPIPRLRRGKIAGQEFEVDVARIEREMAASIDITSDELSARVDVLEAAFQKLWTKLQAPPSATEKEDV